MSNASGPRILVVDDEPNIVDVVAMALRYQGFAVSTAATGAEAIAQMHAFRWQLMVLDVMLPDMTGFDVAERLGGQWNLLPIVFLTARDAQDDKLRGLTPGGDDYVTKPFSLGSSSRGSARSCGAPDSRTAAPADWCSRIWSSTRTPARCSVPGSSLS